MRVGIILSIVVMSVLGSLPSTGEESALLDVLQSKGVLSVEDVETLSGASARAAYPQVTVGGRIMADVARYDSDDADFSGGSEFRRARVFVKGRVAPEWFYKLQYDFVGRGSAGLRDAYFGYDGFENTRLRFGQMIEAGSLEDSMSSKYITFMERALPVLAFSPAIRRMGVRADTHGGAWHAAAGVFGENAAAGVLDANASEDEGVGVSSRLSCAPWHDAGHVLHLGLSAQYRRPRGDRVRSLARPEAHVAATRLVDTGTISNVNATVKAGLEAAWVQGPFSMQGEYIGVNVDRDAAESAVLQGFYVYASWFLTGESRPYDVVSGEFVRLKPANAFGEGGVGAWELALRYSELDLNDEFRGGVEKNVTAGMNWYVNSAVRFMFNYVHATSETDNGDVDVDIAQARAQVDF